MKQVEIKNADDSPYDLLVLPIYPSSGIPMGVTRLVPNESGTFEVDASKSIRIDLVAPGANSPAEGGLPEVPDVGGGGGPQEPA
jgi:hypothetical protein